MNELDKLRYLLYTEQVTHQQQRDALQKQLDDQARIIRELESEMKGLRIRLQRAHAQEGDNDGG